MIYFWYSEKLGWTFTGADRYWLKYSEMVAVFLSGETGAGGVLDLLDTLSPAPAVEPDLCEDEGCPMHGTPHVCIDVATREVDLTTTPGAVVGEHRGPLPVAVHEGKPTPTNDQIAAVMLQHGTPEQQTEALAYAGAQVHDPEAKARELYNKHIADVSQRSKVNPEHYPKWADLTQGSKNNWLTAAAAMQREAAKESNDGPRE